MKIIYKQTPMNERKRLKFCSRCRTQIHHGQDYNLHMKEIVCNSCVKDDEYVSRIKIFKGSGEIFRYEGLSWDVEGIIENIIDKNSSRMKYLEFEKINYMNHNIKIIPEKLRRADPTVPGILVEYPNGKVLLIDGYHRMEKIRRNGGDMMPFYVLTFKEAFMHMVYMDRLELFFFLANTVYGG